MRLSRLTLIELTKVDNLSVHYNIKVYNTKLVILNTDLLYCTFVRRRQHIQYPLKAHCIIDPINVNIFFFSNRNVFAICYK